MSLFIETLISKKEELIKLLGEHIQLTVIAVVIAVLIGVPIGIFITNYKKVSKVVIGIANLVQAIPSLALLGFFIPILGIGAVPAITMVVLYSMLPLIKNTYTGIINISPDILEASKGIGMTNRQTLRLVKIPLAMPVIMAGVRISAVTAVGLMTIAAFVGAGGLGYLVFSGIQTVDNNLILMGAIPAAILALIMDYITAKIEQSVMPCGIKKPDGTIKTKKGGKFPFNKKGLMIASMLIVIVMAVGFIKSTDKKIVVASKNFTEQLILGNIMSDLIEEKTDLDVERKLNLGGSKIALSAIKAGEVDIYAEYTGTGYVNIFNITDGNTNSDEVYDIVKKKFKDEMNLVMLKPFGFNNTYALAVRKDTAEEYELKTVSDIVQYSNKLLISPTIEFANRQDGLLGMEKVYGLKFKEVKPVDGALRYNALENRESDVIDAFTTDGLIDKMGLEILEDDKNFFPPYYAAPLVREETLKDYPELRDVLQLLEGKINDEKMRKMNYEVDVNGRDPKEVAREFLVNEGLL